MGKGKEIEEVEVTGLSVSAQSYVGKIIALCRPMRKKVVARTQPKLS